MKKIAALSIAFCFVLTAFAGAQDTRIIPGMASGMNKNKTSKPGKMPQEGMGGKCESGGATCEGDECPIVAKAMESLPKMVFRIGENETCCHMTATRMAHKAHEEIIFVVGKKTFRNSEDAFEAHVKQTETYVKKFITPKVCAESGATTVAGETCQCTVSAGKMSELVNNATQDLKITYAVGEKEFDKYNDARRFARKTRAKGMYVVTGERFENEFEARLALAHQKFRAAVTAAQTVKTEAGPAADSETQKQKDASLANRGS